LKTTPEYIPQATILQIGKYWHPEKGGIESVTKGLWDYFLKLGFSQTLIVFGTKNCVSKLANDSRIIKIKCIRVFGKVPFSIYFFIRAFNEVKKRQIIHVHLPNPIALLFLLMLPKGAGKKIIVHWHSDVIGFGMFRILNGFVEKYVLRNKVNWILATSPNYVSLSPTLQLNRSKVRIVPNFIDPNYFSSNRAIRKEKKGDLIRLLSVGRFTKYKGYENLISALKDLKINFEFNIVGSGVSRLISNDYVKNKIIFHENCSFDQLCDIYSSCDIFLLGSTSRAEAFGIVLLEAMYFRLPTIAFDVMGSGISNVIDNGVTGFLIEPDDYNDYLDKISLLSNNYTLRINMGVKGRERLIDYFTIDKIGKSLIDLYLEKTC
jgi:glycosyltransferase involved in cell wall biosynthesis